MPIRRGVKSIAIKFPFVLLLAFLSSAFAGDPVRLWNAQGEVIPAYSASVRSLPSGTELILREGSPPKTARIVKYLGSGMTTVIYEIEDGRAIRLAKGDGLTAVGPTFDAYLTWFAEGARGVERTRAPIVKVFHDDSWDSRFIIVEALRPPPETSVLYSLEDLVKGRVDDPKLAERMKTAILKDFAPQTWELRFLADMRAEQILFTQRGWVIADLSVTVKTAKSVRDSTIFSAMGQLPPRWRLELEREVFAARRTADLNGNFLQLGLSEIRRCRGWLTGMMK